MMKSQTQKSDQIIKVTVNEVWCDWLVLFVFDEKKSEEQRGLDCTTDRPQLKQVRFSNFFLYLTQVN